MIDSALPKNHPQSGRYSQYRTVLMILISQKRLIIVEDKELFRTVLTRYCQNWGYTIVATCKNGRDAIVQAERLQPNLMLLDLDLPIFSGFEVATALRKKLPKTRIVMISADVNAQTVERGLKIGVDGIFDKRHDTFERIGQVLPEILRGGTYFSPTAARWIPVADAQKRVSESAL